MFWEASFCFEVPLNDILLVTGHSLFTDSTNISVLQGTVALGSERYNGEERQSTCLLEFVF